MELQERIKAIKLGQSLILDLGLADAKDKISETGTKKRFKYIPINETTTTIVRVAGSKTTQSKIEQMCENGDVFVGCFVDGCSKTVRNVVSIMNKTKGYNIIYRDYNGKAYVFEDLLTRETITLDEFKAISAAMENKKEILENKILI